MLLKNGLEKRMKMKRSEMIKKLVPLYADHIEKNGCVIVDVLMKEIIYKAVEAGMLPPTYTYGHEWEPEGE